MGWNLPSLPGVGTIATVANWATKVIDSLRYLKGLDGDVTIEDDIITTHNIDGVDVSKLGDGSQAYNNLLTNGDFEIGDPPTGWTNLTGTFVRSTTQVKTGTYSGKVGNTADQGAQTYQEIPNSAYYKSRILAYGCWVWADTPGRVRLGIFDGVDETFGAPHSGGSTWEWLTVTKTIGAGATLVRCQLRIESGTAIFAYFDGAILVEGDICPAFSPHPTDITVIKSVLTTAGDIPYATAASTWAKLGIGTASQFLRVNAGATAPEWTSGAIPAGGIIIWTGTIANIPAGFVICDGNNSSPNLLTRFLEGVATAATNPGTTGGATAKNLDIGAAEADLSGGTICRVDTAGSIIKTPATSATNSYSVSATISDIRPLYYDVAYIMKS